MNNNISRSREWLTYILRYNFGSMDKNFAWLLSEKLNLVPDKPILIGLSGGADSLCLFHLFHQSGYKIIAAHFNHNLRSESIMDAKQVETLADVNNVPFVGGSEDVARYSVENKLSIEEAARNLRYQFLFSQARKRGAQAVAVGHHADDQVESVLMHLLRGSGLAGLRGMQYWQLPNLWSSEIALIRPLLSFWRREIEAFCQDVGLIPLEDRTNSDIKYWRNRIRLELIPFLETFNPQVKQVIYRLSRTISSDFHILESQVSNSWDVCVSESGNGYVALLKNEFELQPLALRRMLIRKCIENIRTNLRDINFDLIEGVLQSITAPPLTRRMDIGAGIRVILEKDLVWIKAIEAELPSQSWPQIQDSLTSPLMLMIPGKVNLGNGWVIKSNEVKADVALKSLHENKDPYECFLELPESVKNLHIRSRNAGDRFKPFGLAGHSQKLADYMINVKLPLRSRIKWPLICAGDEILWIPGYTASDSARVTQESKRVVFLKLHKH